MTTHDTIADRFEIQDLMSRYALAVDNKNWDLYRSVFTADARIDYTDSGGVADVVDKIVPWLSGVLGAFAGTQHSLSNHLVEFDGAGHARSCTYFVSVHVAIDDGEEQLLTVGGFYRDRLERTSSGWRISERVELGTWMEGPYPEDVERPPWYGREGRHRPSLGVRGG